ncbi:hypothetical protein TNCV_1957621 [Trichonephila clavipes]|nr:hypothetical protein TNCV_1957621 [Trichonephila clavipes]
MNFRTEETSISFRRKPRSNKKHEKPKKRRLKAIYESVDAIPNKIAYPQIGGFLELLEEMDLVPKMPAFLDKQAQLSIEKANETRLVISIR